MVSHKPGDTCRKWMGQQVGDGKYRRLLKSGN